MDAARVARRTELFEAMFDESKHPRGPGGKWGLGAMKHELMTKSMGDTEFSIKRRKFIQAIGSK